MQAGFIQCRDGLYWTANVRPVAALPVLSDERIDLSDGEGGGLFRGYLTAAQCCKTCKKVIVDYS